MGILAAEALGIWCLVAVLTGFGVGAVLQNGKRLRKDEFLTFLFATIANRRVCRELVR